MSTEERGPRFGAVRESGSDAVHLVIDYARQETLGTLRGLGRFVAFGTAGTLLVTVGAVLVLLAILRALQGETGTFHGNLSWVPYLIVAVVGLAVAALATWRVTQGPATRRSGPPGPSGKGEDA